MQRLSNRLAVALLALALTAGAARAEPSPERGRPVTPDDVVELESFGRAAISPDGRWAVYEKRGGYDTALCFDYAARSTWTIMDLWRIDLSRPETPPVRLLPDEGLGLQRVAWSPDARRLLVTRLRDDRMEFGVADVDARTVRWLGLTPELPRTGATAAWASSGRLVLLTRADNSLPALIRHDSGAQSRIAEAWRRSALGRDPSRTVIDARAGVVVAETAPSPIALVELDLDLGTRRVLIEGQLSDFSVSPDGRQVAVLEGDGGAPLSPDSVIQLESAERQRLVVVSLADGTTTRPLPGQDIGGQLLRWSPGSRAVLVWARPDGAAWDAGRLVEVSEQKVDEVSLGDLSPGSVGEIVGGVRADWIGETPVLFARPMEGRFDWWRLDGGKSPVNLTASLRSPPSKIVAAGDDALHILADGSAWSMTDKGLRSEASGARIVAEAAPMDAELVRRLRSNDAPRRDWAVGTGATGDSIILVGGQGRRLGSGAFNEPRILAVSPQTVLLLQRSGLKETLLLRTGRGDRPIDAINTDKADVALIDPVAVTHADVDGRPTRSWLYLPPPGVPVRGVIVDVYPGAAEALLWWDPLSITYGMRPQVFAAAGFALLRPSIPATAPVAERGDVFARAADLAVDAALAAYPQLPTDRLAVRGQSFGGYTALEIAVRSSRYRAYVVSAGYSDPMGYWGELYPAARAQPEDGLFVRQAQGWTEAGQGGLGGPPWSEAEAYLATSPFLKADRVTAPVLLLTADLDFVPATQAERMFSALLRHGKTARLATYWGEHHHVWSPANIKDRYQMTFEWLDQAFSGALEVTSSNASAGPPTASPSLRTPPPP